MSRRLRPVARPVCPSNACDRRLSASCLEADVCIPVSLCWPKRGAIQGVRAIDAGRSSATYRRAGWRYGASGRRRICTSVLGAYIAEPAVHARHPTALGPPSPLRGVELRASDDQRLRALQDRHRPVLVAHGRADEGRRRLRRRASPSEASSRASPRSRSRSSARSPSPAGATRPTRRSCSASAALAPEAVDPDAAEALVDDVAPDETPAARGPPRHRLRSGERDPLRRRHARAAPSRIRCAWSRATRTARRSPTRPGSRSAAASSCATARSEGDAEAEAPRPLSLPLRRRTPGARPRIGACRSRSSCAPTKRRCARRARSEAHVERVLAAMFACIDRGLAPFGPAAGRPRGRAPRAGDLRRG